MIISHEVLVNEFGQNLISLDRLLVIFRSLTQEEKKNFLTDLVFLIMQSKPIANDGELAVLESKMKPSYTPAVLLKKGLDVNNLKRIVDLPPHENEKAFILLMNLFKISYNRRFLIEKNNPNKWWYWDLSDQSKKNELMQTRFDK